MAKAELGVKRRCLSCGAPFFDLNREPIACPKCGAVFQVVELPHSAQRKTPYRPNVGHAALDDERVSTAHAASEDADADLEADALENDDSDDSVVQPIDEDEKIEKIDDLI